MIDVLFIIVLVLLPLLCVHWLRQDERNAAATFRRVVRRTDRVWRR